MLKFCPNCKENSAVIKCYTRKKDNKRRRVMFCLNFGCGYKEELLFEEEILLRRDDKI